MGLPAGEIEALRAAAAEALKLTGLTADIQRNPNIGNPVKGSIPDDWSSILPGGIPVACGMRKPSQALLQQHAALIGTQQAAVISFAYGQDVVARDRLIISTQTWTVHAPLSPDSLSVLTQVLATRLV